MPARSTEKTGTSSWAKGGAVLGAAAATALMGALTCWRARHVNPYRPVLERLQLLLPGRSEFLAGLRIGFITDIHAGPFMGPADVERATDLLAAASPDVVLLGGDYVSESPRHLSRTIPLLGDLCRAVPLGGFAVLGNHDLFVSAPKVQAALEQEGIRVLRNEAVAIQWNRGAVWIVGIDDSLHGRPDIDLAFASVPAGAPSIALWHEPELAAQVAGRGSLVQLSGHTHGGQIQIPGLRPVWLPLHGRRHVIGLNVVDGMPVYTSRGAGVYRPPFRLNCPPEVTLITFMQSASTAALKKWQTDRANLQWEWFIR